ncbi:GspE/PulE family protein [Actimicrobium sp. CCC2.4]|uniref:GspE/PulE family protein n=1 Tax=Actimicrobium sp. CCC2.4 TaxID=3048606 RepID=UPI002AC9CFD2|nr:GspE/PulE family protein [Actimicrobium sp. CCC2.4]MEB0134698.1 GspE/PulE family protein [Actimicrobium sp. CCC2.4]WPX30641.1 GspE/PulE family protein [Actimicrobium sp. CCC2.4]
MYSLEKIRLGEILTKQNLLTSEQLKLSLNEQQLTGVKLGRILINRGFVTEEILSGALARQLNIPHIRLKRYNIKPQTVFRLPEMQARRFRAIALEEHGGTLLIGMANPTDLFAYDEIKRFLKCEIKLAVVDETELLHTIDSLYRRTDEISGLARELEQELTDSAVDFGALSVLPGTEDAPVVKLLQSVFNDAAQVGASDIHIEPQERGVHIRFRIDGVLHLQTKADIKIAASLALRLKLVANLDIAEKRLPQDGRFTIQVKQKQIDIRLSSMPTQYGESVVMRLLHQHGGVLSLDKIGMPATILDRFRVIMQRPNGLVLVTGPTGSGKTTTLYAALTELNTTEKKLITVEDPIEYRLSGVNQVQVNDKIDLDFAKVLRAALRQDPDVVLVGEIRDQETAQIGMRAAMTGHLVLSTLHTNNAISTPMRLLDMGVPGYVVASSLQAVVAQRLVRLICESCTEAAELHASERVWLEDELGDLVDAHRYMQGRGCPQCNGTGFHGRTGVYEMLDMTPEVIAATHRADPAEFKRAAQLQMAGATLRRHAVSLVISGKTTVSEAIRISNQLDE